MTEKKRGYFGIFLVVLTLILSPISIANQDYAYEQNVVSDEGVELGGFAKVKPVEIGEVYSVSEKTDLLAGPGSCGNPYVAVDLNFPDYFCTDALVDEGLCCPASVPAAYDSTSDSGYPADQTECTNLFMAADPSLIDACERGCCQLDEDCDFLEQAFCNASGGTFLGGDCALYPNCGEVVIPPPEACSTYDGDQSGCTGTQACYYCQDNDQCLDSCSGCPDGESSIDRICGLLGEDTCDNNIDDDNDGYNDTDDMCCQFYPLDERLDCACAAPFFTPVRFEWQCPADDYFNESQFNTALSYDDDKYDGCCKTVPTRIRSCMNRIAENVSSGSDIDKYCVCYDQDQEEEILFSYDESIPSDLFCCGGVIRDNACQLYELDIKVEAFDDGSLIPVDEVGPVTISGAIKDDVEVFPTDDNGDGVYEYAERLYEGQYRLRVEADGFERTILDFYLDEEKTGPNAIVAQINKETTLDDYCRKIWPRPSLTIEPVQCSRNLTVSWDFFCDADIDQYLVEIEGEDEYSESRYIEQGQTQTIFNDLIPSEEYTITLTIIGGNENLDVNRSIYRTGQTVGQIECTDDPYCTDTRCDDNSIKFCNDSNVLETFDTCDGSSDPPEVCVETGAGAGCVISGGCVGIALAPGETIPSGHDTPNIFGLYYYDYRNECYFDESDDRKACYYDIYSLDDDLTTETVTDVCISCEHVESCYDYKSKAACEDTGDTSYIADSCAVAKSGQGCKWYDGNFGSFGMGYCYDPIEDQTEGEAISDQCWRCGDNDDNIFKNTGCTGEVCGYLGECFANYQNTECFSCQDSVSSCRSYENQEDCDNDPCNLGVCDWNTLGASSVCCKDNDGIPGCDCDALDPGCVEDTRTPTTDADIPAEFNSGTNTIYFTPNDNIDENVVVHYCIGLIDYDPVNPLCLISGQESIAIRDDDPLKVDVDVVGSSNDFKNKEGLIYITYWSEDEHDNVEDIRTVEREIDSVKPNINASWTVFESPDPTKSDLNITLSTDEEVTCTDHFVEGDLLGVMDAWPIEAERTLELFDIGDGTYYYVPGCTDDSGNNATYWDQGLKRSSFEIIINTNFLIDDTSVLPRLGSNESIFSEFESVELRLSMNESTTNFFGYDCSFTSDEWNGGLVQDPENYWSLSTIANSLSEGQHDVDIFCHKYDDTDVNDTAEAHFYVDTTPPTTTLKSGGYPVNIYGNTIYVFANSIIEFECNGDDISQFSELDNDCNTTKYCLANKADPSCNPVVIGDATPGIDKEYRFCYESKDLVGNTESGCYLVVPDGSGPVINLNINDNHTTDQSTIDLVISLSDTGSGLKTVDYSIINETGDTVAINSTIVSGNTATWTQNGLNIDDGMNTLTVLSSNLAGRYSSKIIRIYKDNHPPEMDVHIYDPSGVEHAPPDTYEYFEAINFTAYVDDVQYTALGFEDNLASITIRKLTADGTQVDLAFTPETRNLLNLGSDEKNFGYVWDPGLNPGDGALEPGTYNVTFIGRDKFAHGTFITKTIVVDDTVPPEVNITFYHQGSPTDILVNDDYIITANVSELLMNNYMLINIGGISIRMNTTDGINYYYGDDNGLFNFNPSAYTTLQGLDETIDLQVTGIDLRSKTLQIDQGGSIDIDTLGPSKVNWPYVQNLAYLISSPYKIVGVAPEDAVSVKVLNCSSQNTCDESVETVIHTGDSQYFENLAGVIYIENPTTINYSVPIGSMIPHLNNYIEFKTSKYNPDLEFYKIVNMEDLGGVATRIILDKGIPSYLTGTSTQGFRMHTTDKPNGRFEFSPALDTGDNLFKAYALDEYDNPGDESDLLTAVYDPTGFAFVNHDPPEGSKIDAPETGIYVETQGYVQVDESSVIFEVNGAAVTSNLDVECNRKKCEIEYDPGSIGYGDFNVNVTATDVLGRTKSDQWSFTIEEGAIPVRRIYANDAELKETPSIQYINDTKPYIHLVYPQQINLMMLDVGGQDITSNCNLIESSPQYRLNCTLNADLGEGNHEIVLQAENPSNQIVSREIFNFISDKTDPDLTSYNIREAEDVGGNDVVTDEAITLDMKVWDTFSVRKVMFSGDITPLDINPRYLNREGPTELPFTFTQDLELDLDVDGWATIYAEIFDYAGNSRISTIPVFLDRPLEMRFIQPVEQRTADTTPDVVVEPLYSAVDSCKITYTDKDNNPREEEMVLSGSYYTATLDYELDSSLGQDANNIVVFECWQPDPGIMQTVDSFIIVDNKTPEISDWGVDDSIYIGSRSDEANDFKYYINANIETSGTVNVTVQANEPVRCMAAIDGCSASPGCSVTSSGYSLNPKMEFSVDNNQDINFTISCEDAVGNAAVQKHLELLVSYQSQIYIVEQGPEGFTNDENPEIFVTTLRNAECTFDNDITITGTSHEINAANLKDWDTDEGTKRINVLCVDPEGLLLDNFIVVEFVLDKGDPQIDVISTIPEETDQLQLDINVNFYDAFSDIYYSVIVNGDVAQTTLSPVGSGIYPITVDLVPGENSIQFTASDEAGNSVSSDIYTVNVEMALLHVLVDGRMPTEEGIVYVGRDRPEFELNLTQPGATYSAYSFFISGPGYSKSIEEGEWDRTDPLLWSYQLTASEALEDGELYDVAPYIDVQGIFEGIYDEQFQMFYDAVDPVIINAEIMDDQGFVDSWEDVLVNVTVDETYLDTIVITGDVKEDVTVEVNGDGYSGIIPVNVTEGQGLKNLVITAYDEAGNSASVQDTTTLDEPIQIIWHEPEAGWTNLTKPEVAIEVIDDPQDQECNISYLSSGPTPIVEALETDDNISYSIDALGFDLRYELPNYENAVNITCIDHYGRTYVVPFTITVDRNIPVINLSSTEGLFIDETMTETFKEYLITNIATTSFGMEIESSEPVTCVYNVDYNNGTTESLSLAPASTNFTAYISIEDQQTVDIDVTCTDTVGDVGVTKTLSVEKDASAAVMIFDLTNGYSNLTDPVLRIGTATQSLCTATYEGNSQTMSSAGGTVHTIPVSQIGLTEAQENVKYRFDISCVNTQPDIFLSQSEIEIMMIPDYSDPVLTVDEPDAPEIIGNSLLFEAVMRAVDRHDNVTIIITTDYYTESIQTTNSTPLVYQNITLVKGLNNVSISARDQAGNIVTETFQIFVPGPIACVLIDGRGECELPDFMRNKYPSLNMSQPIIEGRSVVQQIEMEPVCGAVDENWCKETNPGATGEGTVEYNWYDGTITCEGNDEESEGRHMYSAPGNYFVSARVKNTCGYVMERAVLAEVTES